MYSYFITKYLTKISIISAQRISEFRLVADEFINAKEIDKAIQILQLAVRIDPNEPSFFYSLYELYSQQEKYLAAFKSYAHYMHLTSATGEQYMICGELLEKAGRYWLQNIKLFFSFSLGTQYWHIIKVFWNLNKTQKF